MAVHSEHLECWLAQHYNQPVFGIRNSKYTHTLSHNVRRERCFQVPSSASLAKCNPIRLAGESFLYLVTFAVMRGIVSLRFIGGVKRGV